MPVPRRENHSEEMTDRIRDEQKACSLSGFFLQRKCTFLFLQEDEKNGFSEREDQDNLF